MKYNTVKTRLQDLKIGKKKTIFKNEKYEIYVKRPRELKKEFKDKKYDVGTNIQVWIKDKKRKKEFMPMHLRVLMNLKLIVMNQPKIKNDLLKAFDNIFYGWDPINAISDIKTSKIYIDELYITAILAQLFLIEQEIGFAGKSKYNPKSLWFQGWIRTFLDSNDEIEITVKSIFGFRGSFGTPKAKYTCQDNKNVPKKYNPNAKPLWYLEKTQ